MAAAAMHVEDRLKRSLFSLPAGAGLAPAALFTTLVFTAPAAAADQDFPFSYIPDAKLAAAAQESGVRFRVLGGEVAADHAWPWQVALVRANDANVYEGQYCGGSLITRQWVLTAAHCVYQKAEDGTQVLVAPETIRVLAGTNILQVGTGELLGVAHVYAHPDYDAAAIDNDIALIELARPPEIPSVATVKLPTADIEAQLAAAGTGAIVTGWGRMQDGKFPVDLRQVAISILPRDDCNAAVVEARTTEARETFARIKDTLGVSDDKADEAWQLMLQSIHGPLTDNMVCSGSYAGGEGSCNGDSGGPLVVALPDNSYVQVGIVSWGFTSDTDAESCSVDARFSAYTRVARYEDWIRATITGATR
jgi:secreted trypsin-like serine protease